MSAILKQRVRYAPYLKKLRTGEQCIDLFKHGQYLGWSGFTGVGAPKVIPTTLVDHVEKIIYKVNWDSIYLLGPVLDLKKVDGPKII